ncbi:ATP-binding protein [Alkalinema pantanalense CENA528]|uniref:ATP-binding protein n=1 Tax=Alkalinema pantanalense TaxID=1620705 RepID=UPI003D6FDB27
MVKVTQLHRDLMSLTLYRSTLEDPIAAAFVHLLRSIRQAAPQPSWDGEVLVLEAYSLWFQAIAPLSLSWDSYVRSLVLKADNPLTRMLQKCSIDAINPAVIAAAQRDLSILQGLADLTGETIGAMVNSVVANVELPVWISAESVGIPANQSQTDSDLLSKGSDWSTQLQALGGYYRQHGTGLFATFKAFTWQQGELVGIPNPDPIQTLDLIGYEWQRDALLQNTEALLAGYPALHVLLYGSRGSGKSSLIKSLLQTYGGRGLRLVEVTKAELLSLPQIVEQLRDVPQKFIIFVDDLSFEEDDDAYKALKVVLEGNVTARSLNTVVYATSNRRHLIREFYGDRPRPKDADEIHQWDTLQEKLSFSDRFGLTLTFEPADQTTYLAMVQHLAQRAEIKLPQSEVEFRALQWATRHNGRSGRSARQFIDFLTADLARSPDSL